MKTPEEIGTLVRDAFAGQSGAFQPCAWFDERLDCIRVVTRDCSVLEKRLGTRLTVLVGNYGPQQIVGFTIKGARHFCNENKLSLAMPIKMTSVLDAIIASSPEEAIRLIVDHIFRPLVDKKIDQVEVPEPEAQIA